MNVCLMNFALQGSLALRCVLLAGASPGSCSVFLRLDLAGQGDQDHHLDTSVYLLE